MKARQCPQRTGTSYKSYAGVRFWQAFGSFPESRPQGGVCLGGGGHEKIEGAEQVPEGPYRFLSAAGIGGLSQIESQNPIPNA